MQESIILVPLVDDYGRFCLNKQSTHNQSTVYFSFFVNNRDQPIMTIGCYCSKQDPYREHGMSCKEYYSKKYNELAKIIPIDKAMVLFEPFYRAKH